MERLIQLVNLVSLLLMLVVILSLRRQRIRPEYSIAWLGACAALFLFSIWPGPALWLQRMLGLPDRPLALMLIVFAVFMAVFYKFTARISDLKDSNIALAQRVAMLEYHIHSLDEKVKNSSNRQQ
jgi:hypothetical protein